MDRTYLALTAAAMAALLSVTGCGGGGGGAESGAARTVSIDFPPAGCATDAALVTARGTTRGIAGIAGVTVNSSPATSSDAFAHWIAPTSLPSGEGSLVALAARGDGRAFVSASVPVLRDPPIFSASTGVAFDAVMGRVLVVDFNTGAALAIDPVRLDRDFLSPPATFGAGELIFSFAVAFDSVRHRLLVVELLFNGGSRITRIDIATGERATLSGDGAGAGPALVNPVDLAYDEKNDAIVVTDTSLAAVVIVDPDTGDRSILSDATHGSGALLASPSGVAVDAGRKRALVVDASLKAVIAVSLFNGDRKILSDASHGTGPLLSAPSGLAFDARSDLLLVEDRGLGALVRIDPVDGSRSIAADSGSGVPLASGNAHIAIHPTDESLVYVETFTQVFELDLRRNSSRDIAPALIVGNGQGFRFPTAVAVEPATTDVFVLEFNRNSILKVDGTTGDRTIVSGSGVGSGPNISSPLSMVIDPSVHRALVSNAFGTDVIAVDLSTGERTEFSGAGRGTGPALENVARLAFDADGKRCFAIDESVLGAQAVLSIDPATGDRTVVSNALRGTGPFPTLRDLSLDAATGRLICLSLSASVLAIDVATGDRSILSDMSIDADPPLVSPSALAVDPGTRRAFLVDALGGQLFALVALDLDTGERTLVSDCNGASLGGGPSLGATPLLALDSKRGVAYAFDFFDEAVAVIDLETGERAIRSK